MASNRFLNQLEDTDLLLLEIPYKDTPLTVKDFKSIIITSGQQAFSIMAQRVNILGFGASCSYLTLPLQHESSHRQYVNK